MLPMLLPAGDFMSEVGSKALVCLVVSGVISSAMVVSKVERGEHTRYSKAVTKARLREPLSDASIIAMLVS